MQDKSEKASPVNTKNGFVRNTLQTSTRKIYRNRKKPERKTQREGPKKTRFFRPDLPIRPITGFFRKNSGVEKSRNLPRPPLSEKRHRPTPSEHRKMTLPYGMPPFFQTGIFPVRSIQSSTLREDFIIKASDVLKDATELSKRRTSKRRMNFATFA